MAKQDIELGEVILETGRVGNYLRIRAMHPPTLIEVMSFGPLNAEAALRQTVLAKLRRAILQKTSQK